MVLRKCEGYFPIVKPSEVMRMCALISRELRVTTWSAGASHNELLGGWNKTYGGVSSLRSQFIIHHDGDGEGRSRAC